MSSKETEHTATEYGEPLQDLYFGDRSAVDATYRAKARVLNCAIQEIGMGRYQWYLFVVAGFGWFGDSSWPSVGSIILPLVLKEFHFNSSLLAVATTAGLFVGTLLWGMSSDIWGRRWVFNITLFLAGVFGLAAGAATDFVTLASLLAISNMGVGGNVPIDSTLFLDFMPARHQYLLAVLGVWWSMGSLVLSLAHNKGWRYLLFTLGGISLFLWALRLLALPLLESPRYLVNAGKDAEAVLVIQRIAQFNGMKCGLTVEHLQSLDQKSHERAGEQDSHRARTQGFNHIKALFRNRKMAWSTSLLILVWGLIGVSGSMYDNFVPYLFTIRAVDFEDSSLNITYRNQVILAAVSIPPSCLLGYVVELPLLGRRGSLAIGAGLSGVFLLASTTSRSSNALLGWNCGYYFFSSVMWGVLYTISPEIFPGKDRGTGMGLVSMVQKGISVIGPIIVVYADIRTIVPVYLAGALFILIAFLCLLLPFETNGKASI